MAEPIKFKIAAFDKCGCCNNCYFLYFYYGKQLTATAAILVYSKEFGFLLLEGAKIHGYLDDADYTHFGNEIARSSLPERHPTKPEQDRLNAAHQKDPKAIQDLISAFDLMQHERQDDPIRH